MLRLSDFWELERDASLLNLNYGYLESNTEQALDFGKRWSLHLNTNKHIPLPSRRKSPAPILHRDVERTFVSQLNRSKLLRVLHTLSEYFNDYHQGLSYVAGLMLLVLDEESTVRILVELDSNPNYVQGYWRHEAVQFATDSYVFAAMMKHFLPAIDDHLHWRSIFPETYCQKWFVGFFVHVFPFQQLFSYFTTFCRHGYQYLFQIALSLLQQLQHVILECDDVASVYGLLRFDFQQLKKVGVVQQKEDFFKLSQSILDHADDFDLSLFNIPHLRQQQYQQHIASRISNDNNKRTTDRDSNVDESSCDEDSDDNDNDDDDDDDDGDGADDEGTECQICENMVPEYVCSTCRLVMCDQCHQNRHRTVKNHDVKLVTCEQ